MRKKKKKSGDGTFLTNMGRVSIEVKGGPLRLKVQGEVDPVVLEMAVIVIEVLSGPFPLLKKEEALQTCYDTFAGKVEMNDLQELGRRLVHLSESDSETMQ